MTAYSGCTATGGAVDGLRAVIHRGSAIAEIAHSGYPEATSTGSACASDALSFGGDTVACLDRDR